MSAAGVVTTGDGAELRFTRSGDPDGRSIVLVHGFSLDAATWDPLAERLTAAGFDVVAFDLRGHGASSLGSDTAGLDRLVDDVAAVVDEVGIEQFVLVGHSLGGSIALRARTGGPLDERLDGVVAIGATAHDFRNPIVRMGAALLSSRVGLAMLARPRVGAALLRPWFRRKPDADEVEQLRRTVAACPYETRSAIRKGVSGFDLSPTFSTDGCAVLLVVGAQDQAAPPAQSEGIAQALPQADVVVVDDAGHMVITERADAVAELLVDWIGPKD